MQRALQFCMLALLAGPSMRKYRRALLGALSGDRQFMAVLGSFFSKTTSKCYSRYNRQGFWTLRQDAPVRLENPQTNDR